MAGLRVGRGRLLGALLLALAGTVVMLAALRPVGLLWKGMFELLLPFLGVGGPVETRPLAIPGFPVGMDLPFPGLEAPWPAMGHFATIGTIALVMLFVSFAFSSRFLPLAYFLRAVVLIQGVSLAWFALASPPFPYTTPRYAAGLLAAGAILITSIPAILGFTFYIIDVSLLRKLLLTALLIGHLIVLLPLQVLVHVWLIHQGSLLLQPVLFLVFGLLVEVLVLVAFYGWGMSWPAQGVPELRR
jgi:hypothetical protein